MEDEIREGDTLLTSLVPQMDWADIKDYYTHVIVTDEDPLIKDILKEDDQHVILLSQNPEYEARRIKLEDIRQIWVKKSRMYESLRRKRKKIPKLPYMKLQLFVVILLLFVSRSVYSQDAPLNIGSCVLGKTIISDVYAPQYYFERKIKTSADYEIYKVDRNDSISYGEDQYFEILQDDNDTSYLYNSVAPPNPQYRVLFVPQMKVERYVANNVRLIFFHDTLIQFVYDAVGSLDNLLFDKYRGKGQLENQKSVTSPCKALYKGKRIKNTTAVYSLMDHEANVFSVFISFIGVNSYCEVSSFLTVTSTLLDQSSEYIEAQAEGLRQRKSKVLQELEDSEQRAKANF